MISKLVTEENLKMNQYFTNYLVVIFTWYFDKMLEFFKLDKNYYFNIEENTQNKEDENEEIETSHEIF